VKQQVAELRLATSIEAHDLAIKHGGPYFQFGFDSLVQNSKGRT